MYASSAQETVEVEGGQMQSVSFCHSLSVLLAVVCRLFELRANLNLSVVGVSHILSSSVVSMLLPQVLCAGLKLLFLETYHSILGKTCLFHDLEPSLWKTSPVLFH